MLVTLVVSLYTSRVVLSVLGIEDYGLYNIIGGVVILLSVVSNSMTNATQRFITYELGRSDDRRVSDVFSMSLIAHIIVCLAIIILGETVGLWYVKTQLNIPEGREAAATAVYQLSLAAVVINLIRSPYNASVIAHEKMGFFALMSIAEVLMKLGIVYILLVVRYDKLIWYALLILAIAAVMLLCFVVYCHRKFATCDFRFIIDKAYFGKLFGFLGWSLLGSTASLGTQQAGNLIINKFIGVAVNAAYGVANQVNGAINSFVSSYQMAFTPQLVKLYSQKRMGEFFDLSKRSALLSFYLLFIAAFPIILRVDDILAVWLVEVPEYAGAFCTLLIIYSLIDAIQAPFWIGINATGNIKVYEIWLSAILLLNIPLSIVALRMGMAPYWVLIIRVALNALTAVIRSIHVKHQLSFPIRQYVTHVVARALLVTAVTTALWFAIPHTSFSSSIPGLIIYYAVSVIVISAIIWLIGLSNEDRAGVTKLVRQWVGKSQS